VIVPPPAVKFFGGQICPARQKHAGSLGDAESLRPFHTRVGEIGGWETAANVSDKERVLTAFYCRRCSPLGAFSHISQHRDTGLSR